MSIFTMVSQGVPLRAIARQLNAEGVPAPVPRCNKTKPPSWSPTALHAMLENRLYIGQRVFGKTRWAKQHATGKRTARANDAATWKEHDAPHLAIVQRDLWDKVHAAKAKRAGVARKARAPRGEKLLSGFLECGACGGSFTEAHHAGVLECSWRRNRGEHVCRSTLRINTAEAEARVLAAIQQRVLTPENLHYVVQRTLHELNKRRRSADPVRLRKELAALQAQRDVLIDAHIKGLTDKRESEPLLRAQLERKHELERCLAAAEAEANVYDATALRPAVEAALRQLHAALGASPADRREVLRQLLGPDRLRVYPCRERGYRLEGALRLRLQPPAAAVGTRRGAKVVAGGRYNRVARAFPDGGIPLKCAS